MKLLRAKYIKIKITLTSLATILFLLLSISPHASALSVPNFTYDLIDDSIFLNSNSMSAQQIETFLQSEGSGLSNFQDVENCGSSSGAHYSYYQQYYHCGTSQLAAQIIYDASQAYGINPQVILATLQKEQSLVTTPNPTSSQLNCATGYQSCASGYLGFFNQVDNSTWQFKLDMQLGSGISWWGYTPADYACNGATSLYNTALKAGNNVTFMDDNGTTYANITLQNMSTASLYCYTPYVYNNPSGLYGMPQFGYAGNYYSGSYNFVNYFTLWFGSTTGELLRTVSNGQVYITNYTNGYKYPVNNSNILSDYGTLGMDYTSDANLNTFQTSIPVNNMAQGPDGTLYLVDAGIKLAFSSCGGDVVDYGFTCNSGGFIPLTEGQANKLITGPGVTNLLKSNTNSTIYYIKNGVLHPIQSYDDILSLFGPINFNVLTDDIVSKYPISYFYFAPGTLVKTPNSGTVFIVADSSNLIPISSLQFSQDLGFNGIRTVGPAAIDGYTIDSPIQTEVQCSSKDYVGINGAVYDVTNSLSTYGFSSSSFLSLNSTLCSKLNYSSTALTQYIRTNDGTIYYVSNGQKQAFTNYQAYINNGGNASNTTQVSNYFASLITSGANITQ